jgi:hypothetical protein
MATLRDGNSYGRKQVMELFSRQAHKSEPLPRSGSSRIAHWSHNFIMLGYCARIKYIAGDKGMQDYNNVKTSA